MPTSHQLMPSLFPSSGSAGPRSAFAVVYTLSMISYDLEHPFDQFGLLPWLSLLPTSCVCPASSVVVWCEKLNSLWLWCWWQWCVSCCWPGLALSHPKCKPQQFLVPITGREITQSQLKLGHPVIPQLKWLQENQIWLSVSLSPPFWQPDETV